MRVSETCRKRLPLLGVVAYLIVPGERRKRAEAHFRRAGFEVLAGMGALWRPASPPEEGERRQRIEIQ